jgi:neutral ceramidase
VGTQWEFGFARRDITAWEPGLAMMGWGQTTNLIEGVGEPLHARALVLDQGPVRVAIVLADLMMITDAVRLAVLDRLAHDHPDLRIDERNLVLSATHTHSGPSGFAHYLWLNLMGPGYSDVVFQAIVQGIVAAIVAAHGCRQSGALHYAHTEIDADEGVAFNRAVASYNRNADVEPVPLDAPECAVDRRMSAVRFAAESGELVGMLNWFGVHGTTVHAENTRLHPDHKGVAASLFERDGSIALFCQEASGDVTPNHRFDPLRGTAVGRYDDDLRSAAHVGEVQCRHARLLVESVPADALPLTGPLRVVTRYVDFSSAPVDPRWAPPGAGAHTTPATVGVSMARGTAEGPGPLGRHPWVSRVLNGAARRTRTLRQAVSRTSGLADPKFPLVDLGAGLNGRLLGTVSLRTLPMPIVDPLIRYLKALLADDALGEAPWIAQIVPLQLVCIGPLAIATVPFELTTVAARRLRQTLRETLAPAGISAVVLQTYSNTYVGYITTWEEYQAQGYEGAYTLFGPWSLAALRTAFAGLAEDVVAGRTPPLGPALYRFDPEEIARRRFVKPWGAYGGWGGGGGSVTVTRWGPPARMEGAKRSWSVSERTITDAAPFLGDLAFQAGLPGLGVVRCGQPGAPCWLDCCWGGPASRWPVESPRSGTQPVPAGGIAPAGRCHALVPVRR